MATVPQLQSRLGRLAATLWNFGAEFPVPALDSYDSGEVGFSFTAWLPGVDVPKAATIRIVEIWAPGPREFGIVEYGYDFVDYPLNRRRAFHRHSEGHFLRAFGVTVHEHCEEIVGRPACDHYYGFPVDADEAIRRFTIVWGQPGPLGCNQLRCIR